MADFQSRDTRRDDESEAGAPDPPHESDDDGSDPTETTADDAGDGVLGVAVVAVASERTIDDDAAGDAVAAAVGDIGEVVTREVIDDRYDGVQSSAGTLVERRDVDVLVTVGGTGVEPADVTVDAIKPLLDKHLPGVGELIRTRCVDAGGTASVRTRATGGTLDGVPVFCLPGDPELARTAAVEVVVPEAATLAELATEPTPEA